jgi:uncharacterized protein involved in response to NO
MASTPRLRENRGPALLSYGFRPFFLLGSIYAGLAVLAWLPLFYGELALATTFGPRDWHIHEMLYGYLPAVITGFLLTSVPNWTGRLPLQGNALLVLVGVWLAGRIAILTSAWIGWRAAAIVDASFLLLVGAMVAREIVAGRNWRNLKVLIVLCVLFTGNVSFHMEAHNNGVAEYGIRLGIAGTVVLIMLIGGRIIPSFTRNWLTRQRVERQKSGRQKFGRDARGRLPASSDGFDFGAMALGAAALLAWCIAPDGMATGAALIFAGLLHAARLARWGGERTLQDPLLLVLHVAYAFVPLGFLLVGAASLGWLPAGAGIHAWTGGAFGGMTLAVMSRVSLGHTGRALIASTATQAVYGLVFLSALARICAVLHPSFSFALLHLAGFAWAAAFLGFAVSYRRVLTGPRLVQVPNQADTASSQETCLPSNG